ncbi:glycoside hydrolase family 66 protein [Paenibacillus sp. HB172176]|uniref:glycoside hydrolase family 66 protein n=1 Tax=Paenibacillus sp. HB172176 TaxID=2493690 RepID=UPI001438E478|nr:glycoside hydrolase family 66 protein [Paenibacillus sp. HB172176]
MRKAGMLLSLVLAMVMVVMSGTVPLPEAHASGTGIIKRVYTDKARYDPSDVATIKVELTNDSGALYSGNVNLSIHHLETQVYTTSQAISLANGNSTTVTFTWTTPGTDFKGYFVSVTAGSSTGATAIDVSSDWTRFPRYGYMSEFPSESSTVSDARVKQTIEDYHTNAFQLYDWMWRHENYIKRTGGVIDSSWTDWSGDNTMYWQTIQNLISSMHDYNAAAMPYTMTYAALNDYESISGVDPEWAMYEDSAHMNPLGFDFVDNDPSTWLWLFNPADSGWQSHIFAQYRDIMNTAGFDGIHLDQMGERSDPYDYDGNVIDLDNSFSGFINNLRDNLDANSLSDKVITFNNVDGAENGWAFNDVTKNADYDFTYTEIWGNANDYIELKALIDKAKRNNGQKAVVLAAYMNYEENTGTKYEAESATLSGVSTNNDHAGYTGSGFVDGFGDSGDYVEFTITAPEDGWYGLVFRYANDTGTNNSRSLYVDSSFVTQMDNFLDQDSWGTWKFDASETVWLTAGTHTVKLARDAGDSGFINLDSLTLGTFNEPSVRLTSAAIAASGASRIEMGEGDQMLGHPYFPNRAKQMRNSLKEAMKNQYNFITAYENLLFDKDVFNTDSGSQFVDISGQPVAGNGEDGSIWSFMKQSDDYSIVHLINMKNSTDTDWRNSDSAPTTLTNLATKVYIGNQESVSGVYIASPDIALGASQSLSFTTGTDSKGKYVSFTVPSLQYWDMIYMDRTFTTPTDDKYEAEDGTKVDVGVNNNHSGYSGSGFVDNFASNDGVTFTVSAAQDDDQALLFRYANGGSDATRDIFVDGNYAGTIPFPATGSWSSWSTSELTVTLKEGIHTITIWKNASNTGAINLDYLDLDKTYVWQFDRQITSAPAGYRITFRTGASGWVHQGVDGWTGVGDYMMRGNGASDALLDHEVSVGPFTSGTTVDFTFLWDDNANGVLETGTDRWEGTDFEISID